MSAAIVYHLLLSLDDGRRHKSYAITDRASFDLCVAEISEEIMKRNNRSAVDILSGIEVFMNSIITDSGLNIYVPVIVKHLGDALSYMNGSLSQVSAILIAADQPSEVRSVFGAESHEAALN